VELLEDGKTPIGGNAKNETEDNLDTPDPHSDLDLVSLVVVCFDEWEAKFCKPIVPIEGKDL